MDKPANLSILVSLYFPKSTKLTTGNTTKLPVYRGSGNITDQIEANSGFSRVLDREVTPGVKLSAPIPFLAGVDMLSPRLTGAVVAFGDSITFSGWPSALEHMLRGIGHTLGVLNQGISGNRILHDSAGSYGGAFGQAAIKRFAHDALAQPGVRWVLVLEGVNDLAHPGVHAPLEQEVSAQEMIAGLETLVREAHQRNVKILGGTILPFEGNPAWTAEREAKRQAVNDWIRTSGVFDGVFDTDRALRDPNHPARLLERYDMGDNLHPNINGLIAIAGCVDLAFFKH